ncbi:MAG: single-stranded DNA-binding protein [Patescibacteria group bacterium]|nr:single-stranded DNA-binding protein [Patescibacteria group bacterium]
MTDFNQAIVLGNLTKDPEMRFTPNGQAVVNFSVATNRRWMDKNTQQMQEAVEFHNVVAWGKLAEICNQILYKGRKALIVGRLQTRNWEGQDGVKRYVTEIIADHVSATGQPKAMGEANLEDATSSPAPKPVTDNKPENTIKEKKDNKKKDEEIDLDEIPF